MLTINIILFLVN